MADNQSERSGRVRNRQTPWDTSNPNNWTLAKLRTELEKLGVFVPASLGRNVIKKLYLENVGRKRDKEPSPERRNGRSRRTTRNSLSSPDTLQTSQGAEGSAEGTALLPVAEEQNIGPIQRSDTESSANINNMAAPMELITEMTQTMRSMQETMLGLQQAVLSAVNGRNESDQTNHSQSNSLQTAYACNHYVESQTVNDVNVLGQHTSDQQIPETGPTSRGTTLSATATSGYFMELQPALKFLWHHAITPNTRAVYQTAFQCYINFLLMTCVLPFVNPDFSNVPVSESLLIYFVTHCASRLKVSYSTIKLYLCGIRFISMENNITFPVNSQLNSLYTILKGVKRTQTRVHTSRQPVTFNILQRMCYWLRQQGDRNKLNNLMLQTVFVIAFYGFLRCGEFTVKDKFDPKFNLCIQDLQVLSDSILLNLKVSKTDPFRQGITIKFFKLNTTICPYESCCLYMQARLKTKPSPLDPLFIYDGLALKRSVFIIQFRRILTCIGLDSSSFYGHSFRIGAASSAASSKVEDHMIKVLGRWSSDSYYRYIKTPDASLKEAHRSMATSRP